MCIKAIAYKKRQRTKCGHPPHGGWPAPGVRDADVRGQRGRAVPKSIRAEFSAGGERRDNVEPCKKCIYRNLCLPIGNLEFFMNQNNLCHAYQD